METRNLKIKMSAALEVSREEFFFAPSSKECSSPGPSAGTIFLMWGAAPPQPSSVVSSITLSAADKAKAWVGGSSALEWKPFSMEKEERR